MSILNRIEQRVILPGDSETRRSQKRLAIIVMFVAAFSTILSAVRGFSADLSIISWIYFAQAAVIVVTLILLIGFPRAYVPLVIVLLCTSYLTNLPAHLLAGGYTSGLELLIWILLPPVIAVLFVDRRAVLFLTLGFSLTVVAAALLEPMARSRLPEFDLRFSILQASSNILFLGFILIGAGLYLFSQIERYRKQADDLLLNILPEPIARRLKNNEETIADQYDDVTILFADIVNFTTMSSGVEPVEVVNKLNEIFSDFDALAVKYGLEKIKTIGDAYMVVGGLPEPVIDHCQAAVEFAVEMLKTIEQHHSWTGEPMRIRIGINSGPVVAGVIGQQKFTYDLWGDTVNVASRMESNGLSNEIQVTQSVKDKLDGQYVFDSRGPIKVKGKGEMMTYLLRVG